MAVSKDLTTRMVYKDNDGIVDTEMAIALEPLHGVVSRYAIMHIKKELYQAWDNNSSNQEIDCSCSFRINYGLPCRHTLPHSRDVVIQPSLIHKRWYLELGAQAGNNMVL